MSTDDTADTAEASTTETDADASTTDDSTSTCGGTTAEADASTEAESASKCGGATTASADASTETESASACGGATTESESESKCGASSSSESSGSGCGASTDDEEAVGSTVEDFDAEPGTLVTVGLGPGKPEGMTARAKAALADAEHIVGYRTYVDLLPDDIAAEAEDIYSTPMCGEVSRTEEAIDRTLAGNDVAIIGSGDPNVYALSGLALEILESKGGSAEAVDFEVVPGVPAAQSCGARLGAPLVNDTVSVSLSDHLTPMAEIESRLEAVASEGFTIAIYNPWSRKRRENFQTCCDILLEYRDPDTPVGIVHGASRDDEATMITDLETLPKLGEEEIVDMTTTIVVGNDETYVWEDRMVTPRGYETKYDY
ncbi:cobalt-factor-III C17-methyltransferase [Natronomonas moolapensis 8.8.11]|uniref:Cobalt-factor-III C17-methyltransferase n=1 Tax=Natronomonas moolapensis (strain DSM 18674 / CECT 7526 / JCM 14361 / 8.8.11) TaxID=268739 RepID=M1Y5P9_NATM8|nr:precorrin-3B C(17)-methyltransferase [Natronomonas moolapensis]CCQ37895.1 cobalt-factor-III C17-methyltransferase [Natronomonas moolapensis 8.8.11]